MIKNIYNTKWNLWIVLVVLLSVVLLSCEREESIIDEPISTGAITTKPNIVLIFADDIGYEVIGAYGQTEYSTPNIDRLASKGMKFTHCYSNPSCSPSRVQIMSGKYNFRNYLGFGILDPAEQTFAHLIKEAGYKTCAVGKWQLLGTDYQQQLAGSVGAWPEEAGFDNYLLWQVSTLGSRFKHPTLTRSGRITETYQNEYGPDLFLDYIKNFIETNKNDDFFIYYPMVLVHDPFVPTPDHESYNDESEHSKNQTKYFAPMVSYMDKIVGEIEQKLIDEGIRDNTLILFVGDNGTDRDVTSFFNGDLITGQKGYTVDAGIHVPFIANWPAQIEAGTVNDNLIDFTDFLPSLMDIASKELPSSFICDGLSFYPQLIGEPSEVREWAFGHYAPNWGIFRDTYLRYAFTKELKLYEDGRIFNIAEDLKEENVLAKEDLTPEQLEFILQLEDVIDTMNISN